MAVRDATPTPGEGTALARGVITNVLAILAASFRAVFMLLIARLLGREALGTFALAWAISEILSKIGLFGLEEGVLALVAKKDAVGDRAGCRFLFKRALTWGLLFNVVVAALGFVAVGALGARIGHDPALVTATSYILLALPGIAAYRISTSVSRGLRVMKHDIWSRGFTETPITILTLVVGFYLGLGAMSSVVAVIVGSSAGGVVAFLLARRLLRDAPREKPEPITLPMLRFAAPIAAYSLLNLLIFRTDVILLGLLIGRAPGVTLEVYGIYCAAMELAAGMPKVRQAFDPIFLPTVARLVVRRDSTGLRESIARVARWVLAVQLPLAGAVALGGGLMLGLFGRGFGGGVAWAAVLAYAHGANSFFGLAESVIMVERPRVNLVNSAITVVVHALWSAALIWKLGAMGAAIGMLLAYFFLGLLRNRVILSFFGWTWPWRALGRPFAVFFLALPAALVPHWLWHGHGYLADGSSVVLLLLGHVVGWKLLGLDAGDRAILAELRAGKRETGK